MNDYMVGDNMQSEDLHQLIKDLSKTIKEVQGIYNIKNIIEEGERFYNKFIQNTNKLDEILSVYDRNLYERVLEEYISTNRTSINVRIPLERFWENYPVELLEELSEKCEHAINQDMKNLCDSITVLFNIEKEFHAARYYAFHEVIKSLYNVENWREPPKTVKRVIRKLRGLLDNLSEIIEYKLDILKQEGNMDEYNYYKYVAVLYMIESDNRMLELYFVCRYLQSKIKDFRNI